MTTADLLARVRASDIRLEVEGDRLVVDAPKGGLTPELRAELTRQKPALLARLAPVPEFVYLKGGLTVPLPALRLAWNLEDRGIPLHTDAFHQFIIPNDPRLTAADRAAIVWWRHHLGAIVEYVAPEIA